MERFKRWLVGRGLSFWLPLLGWVVVFVAIRAIALEADPPLKLPHGRPSQELWAEGAAKAQEARNWALFGRWQTNPADNYQFWRPQAPVWVYSLAAFLKLFGVTLVAHRAHSILVAALGFVVVMQYARHRLSATAWGVLGLLLAGNYYYILYTRVGLIEPMVNLFSALLVYCVYRALTQPLWLVPATWALLLAVFSKMSGLYLLPLLLIGAGVSFARGRSLGWRFWLIPGLHAAALALLAVLYMRSDAYVQRVVWVIAHMAYNRDGATEVDVTRLDPWQLPARLVDWERWRWRFFPLFPVSATLSLLTLAHTAKTWWQKRALDWDALTVLWLLAAWAPLQLTNNTYVRFYLVLFMPMALLGARGFDLALSWLKGRPTWRSALTVAVVATFLNIHGGHYRSWYVHRTHQVRDTNRRVVEVVGPRKAVFVGMWALWLTFETPYEFYTVRNYFNIDKAAQRQLGVTHLMLRPKDLSGSIVRRNFPKPFGKKRLLERFRVKNETISLYALQKPLR